MLGLGCAATEAAAAADGCVGVVAGVGLACPPLPPPLPRSPALAASSSSASSSSPGRRWCESWSSRQKTVIVGSDKRSERRERESGKGGRREREKGRGKKKTNKICKECERRRRSECACVKCTSLPLPLIEAAAAARRLEKRPWCCVLWIGVRPTSLIKEKNGPIVVR